MHRHPHKPQEIIDAIVDCLYNDRQALSSCALASRAFLPASRQHLFKGVVVDGSCRPFDEFLLFLQDAPHLRHLVRDLYLTARPAMAFAFTVYGSPGASLDLSVLAQILALLPRLEALSISGIILDRIPPTMTYIPSFHIPSGALVFLYVHSARDLFALLKLITCKHLSVHTINPTQVHDGNPAEITYPPNAEEVQKMSKLHVFPSELALEELSLTLGRGNAWLGTAFKLTPSLHTITNLDVTWGCMEDVVAFGELLQAVGPCLKSLKLRISQMQFIGLSVVEAIADLKLHACSALTTLSFIVDTDEQVLELMSSIVEVTSKTLSCFRLEWDRSVPAKMLLMSVAPNADHGPAERLEEALLRCHSLQEVHIKWHMLTDQLGEQEIKSGFKRLLSSVDEKTPLQFEIDFHVPNIRISI
ncbi:hypothetical protein EIP86_004996 [Pleurotus ostreatoroseus]|nr:hypothetical protein EIP86_004996 [Pleurotus ostreatoroseus]